VKLLRFKRLGSTSTKAYQLAQQGAGEWTVVVADTQTKGRGRSGRVWESPSGGLWFSVILRPPISPGMAGLIQMLAAVAVLKVLRTTVKGRGKVGVKWPNDIVVGGRKLGGILVETKTAANTLLFAVIGVGINVNQSEESLPDGAVSLRIYTGRERNLQRLLRLILYELESKYGDLQKPSKLVSEWWRHCVHKMKNVRIDSPEGTVAGVNKGIARDGALVVETLPGHLVRVSEGTLRMLD